MIFSARPKPRSLSDNSTTSGSTSLGRLPVRLHEPTPSQDPPRLEGTEPSLPETLPETLPERGGVDQFDAALATHIVSRIESRLPGRIRQLAVDTTENAVILTGECSTFYTKQVAQHAAMGVLEYEQLINNIEVRTVK